MLWEIQIMMDYHIHVERGWDGKIRRDITFKIKQLRNREKERMSTKAYSHGYNETRERDTNRLEIRLCVYK